MSMSAAQDGRARAIEAAREGIKRRSWESWGDGDVPQTPGDFAEAAIDAALADGGVVTREVAIHEREWGNAHFADWQRERVRAERYREALEFYEASFCDGGERARAALSAQERTP